MWTFPDRSKSLLSGEDIINFKQNSLKDIPAGSKEYAPDDSWLEKKQIQAALETHHCLVGAQRIEKKSNLSSAEWLSKVGKAKVTKKAGRHWEVFGHTVNSEDWLLPEEALFLLETNALELYLEGVPLSIEQSYALIVGDFISLSEYRVYSHLSRKGYRVLRHDKEISVTPYEKDIHADQVSLAAKRSIPGSEPEKSKNANSAQGGVSEEVSCGSASSGNAASDVDVGGTASGSKDVIGSNTKHKTGTEPSVQSGALSSDVRDSSKDPLVTESSVSQKDTDEACSSSDAEPIQKVPGAVTNGVPNDSELSGSQNPTNRPPEAQELVAKGNMLISKVQELISIESEGSVTEDASSNADVVEMPSEKPKPDGKPEESMNLDDSSSEDAFPPSSPDLMIVEDERPNQIIEIEDDEPSSEDEEVIIMDVRKPSAHMDTVDLLDSDEDGDVVFIYQKPTNTDPSKWRRWFMTTTEFINFKFPEKPEESTKISKVKLIDLFDLGQKSADSIWKAIPRHDGKDEFINAPDQRFIPSTILPKFAQYRISLHQRDLSPYSERLTPANVDGSHNLNEIVQYGQEPSYFSRNEGYSFHRSRGYNRTAPWFNSNASRPVRNRMFSENSQATRYNNSYQGRSLQRIPQNNDQNQQLVSNGNHNQYFNRNQFNNQNRYFGNFDNHPPRPPLQSQGNFPVPFGNFPNRFGGAQNEGLQMAVMQAYQLQMLAVGLMQSCQTLMQQVPGFMNPVNNTFPADNQVGNNFAGNFNQQPQQFQYNRGHRPYRRPWRGQGRRRYYNDDRVPKVTEIPVTKGKREDSDVVLIGSDEEDKKVKPAIKRKVALNAIASWNKPKRTKLKITTDVKSIKLDLSEPSTSSIVDLDEVPSVKSESPSSSPKLKGSVKRSENHDVSPLSRGDTAAVATTVTPVEASPAAVPVPVQPQENVPTSKEKTDVQPALDVSDDSRPSYEYIVYDEQVSVDSDSMGFVSERTPNAHKSSSRPEPRELPDSSEAVGAPEALEDDSQLTPSENTGLPGSWKSYKQQEYSAEDVQPNRSKALVSMDNERSDIKDVIKSLRVIGPIDDAEAPREELRVSYDVYLPNQPFRKSVRLLPNYRVIIANSDCFPTVFELNYLETTYRDNVPFLYAVVTLDAIRLYNLRSVSLPCLVPDA